MSKFEEWLDRFLAEKKLPNETFQIEHKGAIHYINSEQIIDLIRATSKKEQLAIQKVIVGIDFKNGNVNHFLKHLATGYIESNY